MTQIHRSTAAVATASWKNAQTGRSGLGLAFSAAGVLVVTLLSAMVLIAAEVSAPANVRLGTYEAMSTVEAGTTTQAIDPDQILRSVDTSRLPVENAPAF